MKILVFAHQLELGGTQTNAIELAAAVRDHFGHEVALFATPGPAAELAAAKGVRLIPAPAARRRPSPAMMAALRRAVAAESPDLVHAWDWPQVLDASLGLRVPVLGTSMSMTLERFLPRTVPMTFGTAELQARAAEVWRSPVALLEPPVDTEANRPGAVAPAAFGDGPTAVIVSRLSRTLKLEGVLRAIRAVRSLAATLVIVGDGDAFADVAAEAAVAGGGTAVLTGALADPRPAYAAADVVLAMGGSALRAMAFAKPVVVLGEQGFSEVFSPETAEQFLWRGFYGLGDGDRREHRLAAQLGALFADPARRDALGEFGRRTVDERYALTPAAARLEAMYRQVAAAGPQPRPARLVEGARSLAVRSGTNMVPATVKRRLRARRAA